MIGWWLLGEILQRHSPWIVPNLLATTFYGERAYRESFIIPTWSGLALPFVAYCSAGMLFALIGRERARGLVLLLAGLGTALALNWLWFGVALKRLNPLFDNYSPDRLILVSHLLYGVALANYPSFAKTLEGAGAAVSEIPVPEVPVSAVPVPVVASPEVPVPDVPSEAEPSSDEEIGRSVP